MLVRLQECCLRSHQYHSTHGWMVHRPNGTTLVFQKDTGLCGGMPFIDLTADPSSYTLETKQITDGVAMIETVQKNMEGFTKEEIRKATEAREAQAMMAHPSDAKLKQVVSMTNAVQNCPVTVAAITDAKKYFGPDIGGIRGKTVRKRAEKVRPEYVNIPRELYEQLKEVTLCADVMFVNGLPFFVTLSRHIKLVTIEFLPSRTAKQLCKSLTKVLWIYHRGGFVVRACLMDMEFDKLVDMMAEVMINTTAAREHVGDIERYIRTIKERARSVVSMLPYKKFLHHQVIIHLLKFVAMWMNALPADNGVSDTISPREIVTRLKMNFDKHCKVLFGSYVKASEDSDITNTLRDRTQECIALGPTGNVQGSLACFDINTGEVLTRCTVTSLPMPDRVVKKMIAWGKKSTQMRKQDIALQFLNRRRMPFDWDDGTTPDEDAGLVAPDSSEECSEAANFLGIVLKDDDPTPVVQEPAEDPTSLLTRVRENANLTGTSPDQEITGVDYGDAGPNGDANAVTDDEDEASEGPPELETYEDSSDEESQGDENDDEDDQGFDTQGHDETSVTSGDEDCLEQIMPPQQQQLRQSTRARKTVKPTVVDFKNRKYQVNDGVVHINPAFEDQTREAFKFDTHMQPKLPKISVPTPKAANKKKGNDGHKLPCDATDKEFREVLEDTRLTEGIIFHIVGVIMAQQYSVKKGIELFGEKGEKAVTKELTHMHDMKVYHPMDPKELTREQRKEALLSLIFLTQKRDGSVKSRACVNGSKQRGKISKEAAASPTVMNDSVMITSAIEAHEERNVVTLDLPGAFLHTDLDEDVVMLLKDELVELMVKIDPKLYRPYVITTSKGTKLLYVKMQKAMYGLLRSALLFYLKLVRDLEEFGFELNPYDPCVANKTVGGNQMTVHWHVDDLKVSHKSNLVITEFIRLMASKYGDKITVNRGKIHDYLGMDLDFLQKGIVKMSMIKQIQRASDDFPDEIGKSSSTSASDHLFQVRDPKETEKMGKWLPEEQAVHFHHTVAQLLFISTRVRKDIQTAVAFLTTRVKKPDEDDWGKLKRVLKYLKGTKHLKLTLVVDNMGVIRWWVDASYNAHEDCKGQTGAMMSLGRGAAISSSRKQKLNVRSSAEGELVGIDDALPCILWCRYFIEAQGYTIEQNILYQDNKSTILLATNGRWFSSKRTKHIKSRYFSVKDKIDQGELEVQYMPTEKMWCDTLTKPKQGKGFCIDRSRIMNCDEDYDDDMERLRTDPQMLPKQETTISGAKGKPTHHCRSVLEDNRGYSKVTGGQAGEPTYLPTHPDRRSVRQSRARLLRANQIRKDRASVRGQE